MARDQGNALEVSPNAGRHQRQRRAWGCMIRPVKVLLGFVQILRISASRKVGLADCEQSRGCRFL
jgi:hypothetical protein